MKLSVIVVSYNEKNYIDETIKSIIRQNMSFEYEIIVGDDGSDDGTIAKLEEWKNKENIIYFVMERDDKQVVPSIRVTNVIKRALKMAEGDYFSIIAGDDFYSNMNKFEKQITMLEKYPDCVGCAGLWNLYWNEKKKSDVSFQLNEHLKGQYSKNMLWGSGRYIHVAAFVFRNIFKGRSNELFDNQLSLLDDNGFVWYMYQQGNICFLNEVTFCYRQREESIMGSMKKLDNAILELLLMCDEMKIAPKAKKYIYSRHWMQLREVYRHRDELSNERYKKYLELAEKMQAKELLCFYNNDVSKFYSICIVYYRLLQICLKVYRKIFMQ